MTDNLQEQFGKIYDEYIQKIYRFVYLKVNSQEMAEDITSKVFSGAWQTYKNHNSSSKIENMSAFLYRSASNAVVDYYRQKGKKNAISIQTAEELADQKTSYLDRAVLASDIEVIKTAIQKIKKDYQDVIIWHYLEDMPIAQIAQLADKPEGTVRVMIHRGIKELRQIIES